MKVKDSSEILKMYTDLLLEINRENLGKLNEDLSLYFLHKNIINLYSLEALLQGVTYGRSRMYDLNSISLICRGILETSAIFYCLFYESENQDEVRLKVNLWKLSYFNSSNYKFSSVGYPNMYNDNVDDLKKEIFNNNLDIKILDKDLCKRDVFFDIKDKKIKIISLSVMSERFLSKYIGENPPNYYRNYSEESHTTYNVIRFFEVNPSPNEVQEVVSDHIIHLIYIVNSLIRCFLDYHGIEPTGAVLEMHNNIVNRCHLNV